MEKEKILKLFCQRLEQLRENKGYTQYRLAKKSGINRSQIKRIMEGNNFPSLESIIAIANALEIEVKELFNFSELPSDNKKDQKK